MPRQQRIKSQTGIYHVMLRGNERKNIFNSDEDKQRFIDTLYNKKLGERFFLHAFCLMDNHIHLLLREGAEDISSVMKRITVGYVHYFNNKYKRSGHLFQDRFKSEVVEQESYLLALARYIHQNPVKAGMVKKAADYKWSSYRCYLNLDNYFEKILDKDIILELFSEDQKTAMKRLEEFMNQESEDRFIELIEEVEVMDDGAAREIYEKMLKESDFEPIEERTDLLDNLIREFRAKTNLPIRKIAAITGLNKDKIHKILKM